jgi:hypothetical protein
MNLLKMSSQMVLSAESLVDSDAARICTRDTSDRKTHLECIRFVMDLVVSGEVPFPSKSLSALDTNFWFLDFSHLSTIVFDQRES